MCKQCAESLPRCASCDRKINNTTTDGVCSRCLSLESVRSFSQVRSAFDAASHFFRRVFSCDIARSLREQHPGLVATSGPLLLSALDKDLRTIAFPVDIQALPASLLGGSGCDGCSTAGRTDLKVSRRSKRRYVKGIYVLLGLPYTLFLAHLCHELMHAALFLSNLEAAGNNRYKFTPTDEESLCIAVSLLALDHILSEDLTQDERTLIEFARYQWGSSQAVNKIYSRMAKLQRFKNVRDFLDKVLDGHHITKSVQSIRSSSIHSNPASSNLFNDIRGNGLLTARATIWSRAN